MEGPLLPCPTGDLRTLVGLLQQDLCHVTRCVKPRFAFCDLASSSLWVSLREQVAAAPGAWRVWDSRVQDILSKLWDSTPSSSA